MQTKNEVTVTFLDGAVAHYDFVIGADGVNSVVRTQTSKKDERAFENWRVWYTFIPHTFDTPHTVSEYVGAAELAVTFSSPTSTTLWLDAPAIPGTIDAESGRIERLQKYFEDEHLLLPGALRGLKDSEVTVSDIVEVKTKEIIRGRCILIGDAAHALGPHAGLGGSLAMEDAYELSLTLQKIAGDTANTESHLRAYEKQRNKRIGTARLVSHIVRFGTFVKNPVVRVCISYGMRVVPHAVFIALYGSLIANCEDIQKS